MISFDPNDWTKSVVQALIQIHGFVFQSRIVDQEAEDTILEYDKGAVFVTTDIGRCEMFYARSKECRLELPTVVEGRADGIIAELMEHLQDIDWSRVNMAEPVPEEERRIALFFYDLQKDEQVEINGRKILGLYLVHPAGVEQKVSRQQQGCGFEDKLWAERIAGAALLGDIVGELAIEACAVLDIAFDMHAIHDGKTAVEHSYLTDKNQVVLLPFIKAVVL